jgi:hypothetical protein
MFGIGMSKENPLRVFPLRGKSLRGPENPRIFRAAR